MDSNALAVATLASTIVLACITGWYAWLTRSLAKSAKASATSSQLAAQHAARSALVAVAQLDVDFSLSPFWAYERDESGKKVKTGATVECLGATIFVHEASLVGGREIESAVPGQLGRRLYELSSEAHPSTTFKPPMRLHKGESFKIEPGLYSPFPGLDLHSLDAIIQYSLDGQAPTIERSIRHEEVTS